MPFRSRQIAAVAVDAEGHVCWETALFTPPIEQSIQNPQPAPVVNSRLGFFVEGTTVEALSLRTGRVVWRWSTAEDSGLYDAYIATVDAGIVVVETPVTDTGSSLVGLDEDSGKVRWTYPLGDTADNGGVPTGDGGIALPAPDPSATVTRVLDLTTGKPRWSHPFPAPVPPRSGVVEGSMPAVDSAGDLVTVQLDGSVQAVDDQTGHLLWSRPSGYGSAASAGHLLLLFAPPPGSGGANPSPTQTVTAVVPKSGRTLWMYRAHDAVSSSLVASTPTQVFLDEGAPGRLVALDRRTGRVAWAANASLSLSTTVVTGNNLVTAPEVPELDRPRYLVDRNAATGAVRWQRQITLRIPAISVVHASTGVLVVVAEYTSVTAYRLSDGSRAWKANLPGNLGATAEPIDNGVLVVAPDAARQFDPQ